MKKFSYKYLDIYFENLHNNPPAMLNSTCSKKAIDVWPLVSKSMEAGGYYTSHTREECKKEWRARYELFLTLTDNALFNIISKIEHFENSQD